VVSMLPDVVKMIEDGRSGFLSLTTDLNFLRAGACSSVSSALSNSSQHTTACRKLSLPHQLESKGRPDQLRQFLASRTTYILPDLERRLTHKSFAVNFSTFYPLSSCSKCTIYKRSLTEFICTCACTFEHKRVAYDMCWPLSRFTASFEGLKSTLLRTERFSPETLDRVSYSKSNRLEQL
jgi:hypothetical protein